MRFKRRFKLGAIGHGPAGEQLAKRRGPQIRALVVRPHRATNHHNPARGYPDSQLTAAHPITEP